jgi:hypothetical protein
VYEKVLKRKFVPKRDEVSGGRENHIVRSFKISTHQASLEISSQQELDG